MNGRWVAKLKRQSASDAPASEGYLKVHSPEGGFFHGGNQNWWMKQAHRDALKPATSADNTEKKSAAGNISREKAGGAVKPETPYKLCRRDEGYRLARLGCGVIAMNDIELYLGRKTDLSKQEYEQYVLENWKKTYRIHSDYLNFKTGLYPWKMEKGLRDFLKRNQSRERNVKWAPFWINGKKKQTKLVLDAIRDMLTKDIPVVFAYHTFVEADSIVMYETLEGAAENRPRGERDGIVDSHYMTITGLYEYTDTDPEKDSDSTENKYVLQVESWGRIYYIRYDKYAEKLSYFSNILRVY